MNKRHSPHSLRKPTEADRRKHLAAELSEEKIAELADQMRKARAALLSRVSTEREQEVSYLGQDLGFLLDMIGDFQDSRKDEF